MSIRHRPENPRPWVVRWREDGRERSRAFTRRRDAQDFDAANRRRLEIGAQAPERVTVDAWVGQWIERYGPGWQASTLEQRAWTCDRHISPRLGGITLGALTRQRLLAWRAAMLADGASGHAANSAARVLSAALTAAADEALIPANPLMGVRAVPEAPKTREPIPREVIDALREAMPAERDRHVLDLLAWAGLRPQEMRAMRWRDLGPASVWVGRAVGADGIKATKTGGVRAVARRPELARVVPSGPVDSEALVCPGERGGILNWRNWIRRVWRPACQALGVSHVPYDLRHTFASLLIAEGRTVVEVAAQMGHANPTTTLTHYAHLYAARPLEPRTDHAAA